MSLRKSDIDVDEATVSIERSVVEVGGGMVVKEPKTTAGVRTIALSRSLMPEIAHHLDLFAEAGPDERMFVGAYGVTPTRRSSARIWSRAKKEVGEAEKSQKGVGMANPQNSNVVAATPPTGTGRQQVRWSSITRPGAPKLSGEHWSSEPRSGAQGARVDPTLIN